MQVAGESRTLGPARLSFADQKDVDAFVSTLARFERGEITSDEWRTFRLLNGAYGQRQDDEQMLRVKLPQGVVPAAQLHALAGVASRYSRGFAHITTRQNVQFHFLKLADVPLALRHLAEAGVTSKEACGNSVRSITGCAYAGVAADEAFDVTPYAEALTRHLLRHPLSSTLPRKFKMAFEGCAEDHAVTAIHDLGFRALVRDGVRGFRVTAGGGTGILPTSGSVLFDFLPSNEILEATEAVLGVFHRLGDRKDRSRNRMKFLIRQIGFASFREEVLRELSAIVSDRRLPLPFDPEHPPEESAPDFDRPSPPELWEAGRAAHAVLQGPGLLPVVREPRPSQAGLAAFERTNVRAQKQPGYVTVAVTLPLGDVTAPQLRLLGDLALAYGDGGVRLTAAQGLLLRWVKASSVAELHRRLQAAGLGAAGADTVSDVTSCPGAESCKLAVTHSRGLGRLLHDTLVDRPDLQAAAPGLRLKMSGCPNGCGQHHLGGIGFQGSSRQLDGKALPQYFVMTGGEVTESGAFFGKTVARVPARRVPQAVERLIGLYGAEGAPGETVAAFFRRVGPARQKALLADLERLTTEDAVPEDFVDLGAAPGVAFAVETKAGECAV